MNQATISNANIPQFSRIFFLIILKFKIILEKFSYYRNRN